MDNIYVLFTRKHSLQAQKQLLLLNSHLAQAQEVDLVQVNVQDILFQSDNVIFVRISVHNVSFHIIFVQILVRRPL